MIVALIAISFIAGFVLGMKFILAMTALAIHRSGLDSTKYIQALSDISFSDFLEHVRS